MDFWRYLDGVVTVELTSADLRGAMALIQKEGFQLRELESPDDLTLRFQLRRREYKRLRKLCEKRGEELRALSHKGLYWTLMGLKERPILVLGLTLLVILSIWVPGRVFFVQVEGNGSIPARQIVEAAAQCGIGFGASRRQVRSEKIKNALLEAMPQLSWAGVNTYGCTAVITVRERADIAKEPQLPKVSSIVASRDGIIRQMTVLRGNAVCTVGQAVKAGQVLISGYTDCGLTIQAVAAQGEIFGETNRTLTAVCPANYAQRREETSRKQKISLIIGKKRINFTNSSGNSDTLCAKIYEENYISLPGGFVLPVAIAVETWTFYETAETDYPSAEQLLTAFAQGYLPTQMLAGKILLSQEELAQQDGLWQLRGSYSCYEMLGITRIEENVPDYVKND